MNARVSRLCVAAVACVAAATAAADAPDRAAVGRAVAGQFGAELRTALQDAMAAGGPIAAIKVCNEDAPRIAAAAAQASGATVGRTSLKLRNPDNRPDKHERAVLEEFAAAVAANPGAPPPERLDTLADGRVRFMSAIIVQPPCLACHGDALAPPVAAAIGALYPDDQARGYQAGELRGAFTITWPAD